MARALSQCSIEVHAFEANPNLPGVLTNAAKVHYVSSIKTKSLIKDLLSFRHTIPRERSIIIFPTNDNNVELIGHHMELLAQYFVVSWQDDANVVLDLLLKSNIEKRCQRQKLNYPQSLVVDNLTDISRVSSKFEFPVIIKPVQPQSSFKALKCDSPEQLKQVITQYQGDLPILVQHWISGTDIDLFFGALYLDKGVVLSSFVGNKLESYPKAMGQTTIAVTVNNLDVIALTEQFFMGLKMSGPVSVEFKRDTLGRYWVIEPTVGRTDFWVGLCVDDGCNLLNTEYRHCSGQAVEPSAAIKSTIWYDSERDITAFARHFSKSLPFNKQHYHPSFSYLKMSDLKPFKKALKQGLGRIFQRIKSKKDQSLQIIEPYQIKIFSNILGLPNDAVALLKQAEQQNVFTGFDWYQIFCSHVANLTGQVRFYCLLDNDNNTIAILPLWLQPQKLFGITYFKLSSLTNYYAPIFNLAVNRHQITQQLALTIFLKMIKKSRDSWDFMDIGPIDSELRDELFKVAKSLALPAFPYWLTTNYYHKINSSFEHYMQNRPSKVRNTINRKLKKLEKTTSWKVDIVTDQANINNVIKFYHGIYSDSWKIDEPFPKFINSLITLSATKGWLRLGVLYIEDTPVAVQFWLVANRTAFIYKLAYINSYRQYSVGTILTAKMLEHVIEIDKVEKIDYLTGSDNYKTDWMEQSRNLYGIQIINFRSVSGMILLGRNLFSSLKKYSKNRVNKKAIS